MNEIQPASIESSGNCVPHALSLMRKIAGYNSFLEIRQGSYKVYEILEMVGGCFPHHNIVFFAAENETLNNVHYKKNVQLVFDFLDNNKYHINDYLWSFIYQNDAASEAHMVIGYPVSYDGELSILCVIALQLKKGKQR